MKCSFVHKFVALLLASNYFFFQVELFEDEYQANHPKKYDTCSLTQPSITWESFDKENAPKAFVVDAQIRIHVLFLLHSQPYTLPLPELQYQPVRDKSPPLEASNIPVA